MAHTVDEALVLRAIDFGESDRIVHLLTREGGRVAAIAKGAKRSVRRFPGALDLFHHLRVQIAARRRGGHAMARLDHAVLLSCHGGLRSHPARFALGCYVVELLDRLAPEGAAPGDSRPVFEFGRAALASIASRTPDERMRTFVELRALDALGLRPELGLCTRCGGDLAERGVAGFHVGDGGPVCGRCAREGDDLVRVHLGTLRALEQGLRFELAQLERLALGRAALAEARALLGRFQRFHLGVELRSERFLDEILGARGRRAA